MTQIRKNIAGYNNLFQVSNMKYTVYQIRHIVTGQILYIGKTKNFKKRAYQHLTLHTGTKDWLSSIGTGNVFIEEVAKFDNETDALKYEDELILKYNTIENGYNKYRSGLIKAENPKEYEREHLREYYRNYSREYYQKNNKYREWVREYHKTEKYKEKQKEYRKTDEYRKRQRKYDIERKKTDKYKEYQKKYQIAYRQAKKLGLTIDEYRKMKIDQSTTLEQNKKQPIQLTINFNKKC